MDPLPFWTHQYNDFEASLYHNKGLVVAKLKTPDGSTFTVEKVVFGVLKDQSLVDLVERIKQDVRAFTLFPYPSLEQCQDSSLEQDKEVWVFDAGFGGAYHLRKAKNAYRKRPSFKNNAKILTNLKNALRVPFVGCREDIEKLVTEYQQKLMREKAKEYACKYLSSTEEQEPCLKILQGECPLEELVKWAQGREIQKSPHAQLIEAIAHEFLGKPYLAAESYRKLAQAENSHPAACIKKACSFFKATDPILNYAHFLERIDRKLLQNHQELESILLQKDAIRMTFEKALVIFSQQAPKPVCFICCNPEEEDVSLWVHHVLACDLQKIGVQPIYTAQNLRHVDDYCSFQVQISSADHIMIVCTPQLKKKCTLPSKLGIAQEIRLASQRYHMPHLQGTISLLYLDGNRDSACPDPFFAPIFAGQYATSDLPLEQPAFNYYEMAFELFAPLKGIPNREALGIKECFIDAIKDIINGKDVKSEVDEWRKGRWKKTELGSLQDIQERNTTVPIEAIYPSVTSQKNLPNMPKENLIHMKVSNVPTGLPFFTGRKKELDSLKEIFISHPPASSDNIVRLIYGLPGMGKTELTRAFAREHQQNFSIIWFVNSATAEEKNQSYRELAEKLNISILDKESPQQIKRKVHACLQNHTYDKPWLLVFDNVEKEISVPQGGYVLMTSRESNVWRNSCEWISLGEFAQEDSLKILKDITRQESSLMAELATELGHFPLALNQAAHYIGSEGSIETYLELFRKNPVCARMDADMRYNRTLQNVWDITLKKLENENPEASAWLKICAHLNPDDIPQEWFNVWLEKQPNAKSWDKMEIIKKLLAFSLIRSHQGKKYSMHRLMQLVVRTATDTEYRFKQAYELVSSQYPIRRNVQGYKCDEKWLAQAISIAESPLVGLIDRLVLADMLDRIGLKLTSLGNHVEALVQHQQALEIRKGVLPPTHPDLAKSHSNVGAALSNLGEHEAALTRHEQALEIRKKALPPKPRDIAMSHNNIGATLSNLGEHGKALVQHRQALEIRIKERLPTHIAMSYNNMGSTLSDLGRHEEALVHHREALKIREVALPPNHPDIANSHDNVRAALSNIG